MTPESEENIKEDLEDIKIIVDKYREEWAIAKVLLEKLDKALFGNGQPGIIQSMEMRLRNLEIKYWISFGAIILLQFLIISGVINLTKLTGK